ncbi:DegQ family serine endoprotease [Oxalobacter paraformigenes]|uniref:Probable periplasmic serine endoprotease DegP-like n=1 Tax=Oxalobacter paraformigenes TaxID=556268 RepID=C3X163_9BURK|nr:DegQ family serine endoprotease [Oxalobacter paraformigenes]EEO26949.1 protease Do [Oxalobacter paraformigenes]
MKKPLLLPFSKLIFLLLSVFVLFFPVDRAFSASSGMVNGLPDLTALVEKVGPAVVNIRTVEKIQSRRNPVYEMDEDFQEYLFRFFGVPRPDSPPAQSRQKEQIRRGLGSGFIISPDGYVLTNHHVIDNADDVFVRLTDNREFKAKVVGSDKRTDVALLKIDGKALPYLKTGKSVDIKAGQWVLAIGSPFALENTVTAGIISAKARDTGDYLPLIQTDVAVNPGNSGGPLINMAGEAVGINSQIYSRSGGYMGISFAIPIDEALRVSEQLKKSGKVTRGQLGIQVGEVSGETAKALNLPDKQGVLVVHVESGSPAEKAGLEAGDIILKFNEQSIEKISELPRLVGDTPPGKTVRLSVWRKGKTLSLPVTVSVMQADVQSARVPQADREGGSMLSSKVLGLTVSDLTAAQKKQLGVKQGVLVTKAENPAVASGIRKGDVILRLNNADVANRNSFQDLVSKIDRKKTAVLLIQRNNMISYRTVQPVNER